MFWLTFLVLFLFFFFLFSFSGFVFTFSPVDDVDPGAEIQASAGKRKETRTGVSKLA